MASLRSELAKAASELTSGDIRFPVEGVEIEFRVAVKKEAKTDGKVKILVVELGGSGSVSKEETHIMKIVLGTPETASGQPLKISRSAQEKP